MSKRRRFTVWLGVALAMLAVFVAHRSSPDSEPQPAFQPRIPPEYEYADAAPGDVHARLLPVVDRFLKPLPAGAKLLDMGCGNGSFLATFRGCGWDLYGLDISASGIAQARAHFPDIRFVRADAAGDLPADFQPGQFDALISVEVIEHLYNPRAMVRNCFRLLKPGGVLVVTTPYHGYLKNLAIALLGKSDDHFNPLADHGHIKFWSEKTLTRILREEGFDQLEFAGAGRAPYLWMHMIMKARKPAEAGASGAAGLGAGARRAS